MGMRPNDQSKTDRSNDLQVWQYSRFPEIVGGGTGVAVTTEDEFDQALDAAQAYTGGLRLLKSSLIRTIARPHCSGWPRVLQRRFVDTQSFS